jgi:hypothetical protein
MPFLCLPDERTHSSSSFSFPYLSPTRVTGRGCVWGSGRSSYTPVGARPPGRGGLDLRRPSFLPEQSRGPRWSRGPAQWWSCHLPRRSRVRGSHVTPRRISTYRGQAWSGLQGSSRWGGVHARTGRWGRACAVGAAWATGQGPRALWLSGIEEECRLIRRRSGRRRSGVSRGGCP